MVILNIKASYLHVACSVVSLGVGVTTAIPPQLRRQQVGVVRRWRLWAAGRFSDRRVLRWALWAEEGGHSGGAARGRACIHTLWSPGDPHVGNGGTAVSHILSAATRRALRLFRGGQRAAGGQRQRLLLDSHPKKMLPHHGWCLVLLVVHGRMRCRRDRILCCSIATFSLVELHL